MQNTTKKDIESAIQELREAMTESMEASQAIDIANLRKIRAHKALTMAQDSVREITQIL